MDATEANALAREAYLLVDSLNSIFSDYLPNSSLNQLNATAGSGRYVQPPALLYELIQTCLRASHKTGGAFDISIGTLSRLWRQARKENRFPSAHEIAEARKYMGWQKILPDSTAQTIRLEKGMQLDLGGIAKGFVAGAVIQWLRSKNITAALADAGGDIVCSAPPPGTKGWVVGINDPYKENELIGERIMAAHEAIATSGHLYQYLEHEGKKYAHIIDPRTGYGVSFQRSVTIIAGDGAAADWLATACSILSIRQSKKLAKSESAALLILQEKNGRLKMYRNRAMKRKLAQR